MSNGKICACGQAVTSTKPEVDFCRECYYSGAAYERAPRFAPMIEAMHDAHIWHTGGGCFGLAAFLRDGRFAFATVAERPDPESLATHPEWYRDGEWTTDAALPNDDQRWYLCIYESADAFGDGVEAVEHRVPLDDEQLTGMLA